jgi:hypothetical protein
LTNPLTGQPFPEQRHPGEPAVGERHRAAQRLPAADARLSAGHQQRDLQQRESTGSAQGQHPVRLSAEQRESTHVPVLEVQLGRDRRLPRHIPVRPNGLGPSQSTQTVSWTSTLRSNLINEATYTHSLDQVFINVFTGTELYKRSRTGINYPYIFPANKEIPDKIPTITIANFTEIDGGPYPSSSQGPIHTFTDAATLVKGRHTFKAGAVIEYSGEDDFDQINVQAIPGSTNNQNGRFEFQDNRAGGTGLGGRQCGDGPLQQLR